MGTLIYQDMLALYNDVDNKFYDVVNEHNSLDARALSKLGDVLHEARTLQEELENNARWMAACGTPMPAAETTELRNNVEVLVEGILAARSRRAGLIREALQDAGL